MDFSNLVVALASATFQMFFTAAVVDPNDNYNKYSILVHSESRGCNLGYLFKKLCYIF